MWYDLNVTTGGDFYLWALANAPDTSADTALGQRRRHAADVQLTAHGHREHLELGAADVHRPPPCQPARTP